VADSVDRDGARADVDEPEVAAGVVPAPAPAWASTEPLTIACESWFAPVPTTPTPTSSALAEES